MEKEKINFEITKDVLSNDLKIFVKSEIIDKALKELKRTDKSNLAIIQDTIKILENGFNVPLEKINPGQGMGPNLSAGLYTPLKSEPIPNTVKMGKVILPDTNFFNESINNKDLMSGDTISDEIAKSINNSIKIDPCDPLSVNNMFMGGMK